MVNPYSRLDTVYRPKIQYNLICKTILLKGSEPLLPLNTTKCNKGAKFRLETSIPNNGYSKLCIKLR